MTTLPEILARTIPGPKPGCRVLPGRRRYACLRVDNRTIGAHRVVWMLANHAPIPAGQEVCHSCDVTRCIAPDHLFLGTHAQNMADRDAKGRNGTMGENSPLSKLTAESVRQIYALAHCGNEYEELADMFGVSLITIQRIAKRQTWKHILPTTQPS